MNEVGDYGKLGLEIGKGRERTAREVGTDMVLIEYHGKENQELATREFIAAQFYLQRILNLLLPNNTPRVFAVGDKSLLIERIPETPDFKKANEINALYRDVDKRHLITSEQKQWLEDTTNKILQTDEFRLLTRIFEALGLHGGLDERPDEMAKPMNTVMIDSHPVYMEVLKPIVSADTGEIIPRLKTDGLAAVVEEGVEEGFLSAGLGIQIMTLAKRYQHCAEQAAQQAQALGKTIY